MYVDWPIQDFFQGGDFFKDISSEGGDTLPGGGEKIARYALPLLYDRSN